MTLKFSKDYQQFNMLSRYNKFKIIDCRVKDCQYHQTSTIELFILFAFCAVIFFYFFFICIFCVYITSEFVVNALGGVSSAQSRSVMTTVFHLKIKKY